MDRSENNENGASIFIGDKIRQLINERALTKNEVSAYLDKTEEDLEQIYKNGRIDVEDLIKLSELLNYNLFVLYLDNQVIKSLFEDQMARLHPEIAELVHRLKIKDEEIARLTALIETQRKISALSETITFLQSWDKK